MTSNEEPTSATAAVNPTSTWSRNWRIFSEASGIKDGGTRMDAGIAAVYEAGRLAGLAEATQSDAPKPEVFGLKAFALAGVLILCFISILGGTGLMPESWSPEFWLTELACVVLALTLAHMSRRAK